MSSIYAGDVTSARQDIREAGTVATLRRSVPGAYDPVTGVFGAATVETQEVYVVVLSIGGGRDAGGGSRVNSFEAGNFKRTQQRRLLMATKADSTWEPDSGHEVYVEAHWWKVTGNGPLRPDAGPSIMYEVSVER